MTTTLTNHLLEIQFDLSRIDGFSIFLSIIGYVVVFIALTLLYYCFRLIPFFLQLKRKKKISEPGSGTILPIDEDISGEVNAAIAMSLYLYFNEVHDNESNVITIKRISKTYSPWSSKIYNMGLRPNH